MAQAIDNFRSKLNKLIIDNHLSQTSFARSAGFIPSQVNRWIRGENEPSLDNLQKIANFFGITAADLISDGVLPSISTREPTPLEALKIIEKALKAKEAPSKKKE